MIRYAFALTVILYFCIAGARADGCKYALDGRLVPEREQRAFIEWADGIETLHVAALSDSAAGGSVWVVPVRANPKDIRAEPVEEFPVVPYYRTLRNIAKENLQSAILAVGFLNSGGLSCPLLPIGCGGSAAAAKEESRIEKYGMIATVVSARSRDEIERYLDAQGVNRKGIDLDSLLPYFGRDGFAFACGWIAGDKPATATGLKLVFPSPNIWFPLQPTRAYRNQVVTVLYFRGDARPLPGETLAGLDCEYVRGVVEARGVAQQFEKRDYIPAEYRYQFSGKVEPLTRISLSDDPQTWDRDLELLPGKTVEGEFLEALAGWLFVFSPVWSALLGAVFGLLIPWFTIPRTVRKRSDWLSGAIVGGAIVCSIWVVFAVLAAWRRWRFPDKPRPEDQYLLVFYIALLHFLIVFAVCRFLIRWIEA